MRCFEGQSSKMQWGGQVFAEALVIYVNSLVRTHYLGTVLFVNGSVIILSSMTNSLNVLSRISRYAFEMVPEYDGKY